ncbi:MAG TPA: hypothetical protein VHL58_09540 [Thermoanaerobaculia bacterium]|nr:hypothetical protein [Thermoanaerobaculia bacterium]
MNAARGASAALLALCLLFLSVTACHDSRKAVSVAKERRVLANIPRVQATVLSYHVDLLPKRVAFEYLVVIDPVGKTRIGDEADRWRLIDITGRTVTFVNNGDRSYRTVDLPTLVSERRKIVSKELPDGIPRAVVTASVRPETFRSWEARRLTVAVGPYQREVWISTKSLTPEPLLSLLLLSEPLSAPFAGMLRDTVPVFEKVRGMPVLERSRMTWDGKELVIQRVLQSVTSKRVPAAWFQIPEGYRDLTPPSIVAPGAPGVIQRRGLGSVGGRARQDVK